MALYEDTTYNGVVEGPGRWIESGKGTIGFAISIRADTNDLTDFVIWLTKKTADRALETFDIFGVTAADLANASYAENHLPGFVEGKPLSFRMKWEEYKDQRKLKVSFINKVRDSVAEGSTGAAAAKFFRKATGLDTASERADGATVGLVGGPPDDGAPPYDDDIPF